MNYELAKKLKDAGYPLEKAPSQYKLSGYGNSKPDAYREIHPLEGYETGSYFSPTLSELIEAVGFCFATLQQEHNDRTPEGYLKFSGWKATATDCATGWV